VTIIFPPRGVCDFCSAPAEYIEEADDSQVDIVGLQHGQPVDTGLTGISSGDFGRDWASCSECHQLIAAERRESLVARAARGAIADKAEVAAAIANQSVSMQTLKQAIRRMHATFWSARTGGYHAVPR